ncbi:MAG TPA: 50S ribosomal protein L5, partial [Candidatus Dormibacteraeota bacterium]|nr:50S ribosomal protein L5 [Candidatus Dormibacteraeota bacterium]
MAERLREVYDQKVRALLQERFGYKNVNQIPKLTKVVVNMSVGEAIVNSKALDAAVSELAAITGQRPIVTKAKKSIAAFK